MSNTTTSPNMNLVVPTVDVDPGPDWANNLNASLSIIDMHNHTSGKGVQIPPAGLNINSDLTIQQNNLTNVRSLRFYPQTTPLSLSTDLGCLYESGVDLYYNDGSGNQIRITSGGSVAGASGTITGLPSGTASASYSAGTFVFQSATNTPATIDGGSFIFRDLTASSKGVTVSPVNALGSNYSLVLPTIPATLSVLQIDTSGNITPLAPDGSSVVITGNQLTAPYSYVKSQFIAPTIQSFSSGSGTYTTPTSPAPVYIKVRMVGGGGGGGGGGSGTPVIGGNGGNSTFGTILTAGGGTGGNTGANGGIGGTNTISGGTTVLNIPGGSGTGSIPTPNTSNWIGGAGGSSFFGGGGGGTYSVNGYAGATNSGAGGGGGYTTMSASYTGSGGGAGGYVESIISSPAATYSYAVGASGTAGASGSSSGGVGGAGLILVEEYYQ